MKIFILTILWLSFFQINNNHIILSCLNLQTPINDYTIENNWNHISQILQQATQLVIYNWGVSEHSMIKVFSHSMPKLRSLIFGIESQYEIQAREITNYQIINNNVANAIFNSSYFGQLQRLSLESTGLNDHSFSFFKQRIKSNLKYLNLRNLRVGKQGFSYLSNIDHFGQLEHLNIAQTLLFEQEAAQSLVKLICGSTTFQQGKRCNSTLQTLDLQFSAISRQGLIIILESIDTSRLRHLNISNNQLYLQTTFKQTNYSAFDVLIKANFSMLESLQMILLNLDSQVCQYFEKWHLPKLTHLNVAFNYLTDECIIKWVNTNNIPHLNSLTIYSNDISDRTLQHLLAQKYRFKSINFGNSQVSNEGLEIFLKFNHEQLETIYLRQLDLKDYNVKIFLKNIHLPKIKQLSFTSNIELFTFFSYVDWTKLQSLVMFKISQCSVSRDIHFLINEKTPLLPHLQFLYLQDIDKNHSDLQQIVQNIPTLFPSLRYAMLAQKQPFQYLNYSLIEISKYSPHLIFDINYVKFRRSFNLADERFQIISLQNILGLGFQYLQQMKRNKRLEQMQEQQMTTGFAQYIDKVFVFANIQKLSFQNYLEIFCLKAIIDLQGIKALPMLSQLKFTFLVQVDDFIDCFSEIDMPNLKILFVKFELTAGTSENFVMNKLVTFLKKLNKLNGIQIYLDTENINLTKKIVDSLNYPFLKSIDLSSNELESNQVISFIKKHEQTLDVLAISSNFLEKGFIKQLAQTKVLLKELYLNSISFSVKQFTEMARLRTEYLKVLQIKQDDLTSTHMIELINQKKNTQKLLFPSLLKIDLSGNDIRKDGINILFETKIPFLNEFYILQSNNPDFLNSLFTYTNRMIQLMIEEEIELYSLSSDLHPRSARWFLKLMLKSKSLSTEDFKILASLDFCRLKVTLLVLNNLYECIALAQILKLVKRVDYLYILFENEEQGLNSSCIARDPSFQSTVLHLGITDSKNTIYIPQFIQQVLKSQHSILSLIIPNLRLPAISFENIFQKNNKNLGHLIQLSVQGNYLGDQSLRQILDSSLQKVQAMSLSYANLTIQSTKHLQNKTLPNLKMLQLTSNYLGDEIVSILSTVNAQNLLSLSLSKVGLSHNGLMNILNLDFPNLIILYLDGNDFDEESMVQFAQHFNKTKMPSLSQISTQLILVNEENFKIITNCFQKLQIKVKLDNPYYILPKNAAKY